MVSYPYTTSPSTLELPALDLASMDVPTISAQIRLREGDETRLINLLQTIDIDINPTSDLYTISNVLPRSKRLDRTTLYQLLRQIYTNCIGVRDLVDALRVLDCELAEVYRYTLRQRVIRVMDQLELEIEAYAAIEGFAAMTCADFAQKNKWLMHNYALSFPAFAGGLGCLNGSAFTQLN
ncbi:hypothetical protein BGX23_000197 [Mortierella sp. AD031]|nr:hypothetical protein BGX23_000197 [Mortierella sp. AD031]